MKHWLRVWAPRLVLAVGGVPSVSLAKPLRLHPAALVQAPSLEPAESVDGQEPGSQESTTSAPANGDGPGSSYASGSSSTSGSPSEQPKQQPGARTVVSQSKDRVTHRQRAASVVTRRDLDERLPRSAPDALRYEPGVYVQQTAHAQGSPYVRGLTGQQTLMMFDGVRLNNSTFRQGPNQYFFTIDSRTLRRLEVIRGSASTEFGSDAIGGALLATPLDPTLKPTKGWHVAPRASLQTATADGAIGGR
ncbi:MAG: TonB-dependent receptor plug domain-containing protein, partial [Nannocystaceae bacterium]